MKVKLTIIQTTESEIEKDFDFPTIIKDIFSYDNFKEIVEYAVENNISEDDWSEENVELITNQVLDKLKELLENGTFSNI